MKGSYLGHLDHDDPLYGFIQREIAAQLGFISSGADYRVYKFTCSQSVYLYEERQRMVSIGDAGRWDRRVFQPYYYLRRFWLQEA